MSFNTWTEIDWVLFEKQVSRLQRRIYKASMTGNKGKIHFLQKKLIASTAAQFLSVKRVTQLNKGRKTPGVDKISDLDNKQKFRLALNLKSTGKASSIKRIWIPKPGKKEMRPLGIPTIKDRCLQQLFRLALEPEWEARFEANSYGFRPGRSCHDAIQAIFIHSRGRSLYVLDADIAKCFDQISHDKLLAKLNTFSVMENQIRAWLSAGVMENNSEGKLDLIPNRQGTPQGGIISPLLANIALHGMETDVKEYYVKHLYKGSKSLSYKERSTQIAVIRYADDFVVLHPDERIIYNIKVFIAGWLKLHAELTLSQEKTRIINSTSGYKFLGFHIISVIKEGKPKCKIHIHKDSKKNFLNKTRSIIQANRSASSANLILMLNPLIVGWCNYFKYSECVDDFKQVEYALFGQLRAWAFRRRSKGLRSKTDIKQKYFPQDTCVKFQGVLHKGSWIFTGKIEDRNKKIKLVFLVWPSWIRSDFWVKIKGTASPFNGDSIYWARKNAKYSDMRKSLVRLIVSQNYRCVLCGQLFTNNDHIEVDHIVPVALNGTDKRENLQALHDYCHAKKSKIDIKLIRNEKEVNRLNESKLK